MPLALIQLPADSPQCCSPVLPMQLAITGHKEYTMATFTCYLHQDGTGVTATIERSDHEALSNHTGHGTCVCEALSEALGIGSTVFESELDELEASVAALRCIPIKMSLTRRTVSLVHML